MLADVSVRTFMRLGHLSKLIQLQMEEIEPADARVLSSVERKVGRFDCSFQVLFGGVKRGPTDRQRVDERRFESVDRQAAPHEPAVQHSRASTSIFNLMRP
jgi:hypothetical protein